MNDFKDTKKILFAVVLLGISLALILELKVWQSMQKGTVATSQQGQKVSAPKGQLAPGFPKDLAIDSTAAIADSFAIPYEKFGQYTSNFTSAKSVADEYKIYLSYLKNNGFNIISNQSKPGFAYLYGIKTGADINVTITKVDTHTNILVTYLAK